MTELIFISYSRKDGFDIAKNLYDSLRRKGYNPWLDKIDIKPGELWSEHLEFAIRTCQILLFVATVQSAKSTRCNAECERALAYKKPVVPLKYSDVMLPLFLEQRQYISFIKSEDLGFSELVDYLDFLNSPEGELRTLEFRYHDMKLTRDNTNGEMVREELKELREIINFKRGLLTESENAWEKYNQEINLGITKERNLIAQTRHDEYEAPRQRIVGTPPLGINKIFVNRIVEINQITKLILSSSEKSLISIYGKSGTGKTALACKILSELENMKERYVFGITYHSAQNKNLNFEQIYYSCSRILGGRTKNKLDKFWKNTVGNVESKIRILLSFMGENRIVVLLDNLDEIQENNGGITDPDVNKFIHIFLETSHKSKIIITSQQTINLSSKLKNNESIFVLNRGLPIAHGVDLLRQLIGKRNIDSGNLSKTLLKTAVKNVFGYPRALEAIVGILDEDQNISLKNLLDDDKIFNEKVLENLVKEAYSRLSKDSQIIVQALAIFERPTKITAIKYLLKPFFNTIDIPGELRRLLRGYFIKINSKTDEYTIHQLDRIYSYGLISKDKKNHFNVKALERRAASYYSLLETSPKLWLTIADVEPQLRGFSHLCNSGDFDEAAQLIGTIDTKYLVRWGYLKLITKMRTQLIDKIENEQLRGLNYLVLCDVYRRQGEGNLSIENGTNALGVAEDSKDKALENLSLGYLGRTFRNLGRIEEAIKYLERAIDVSREIKDPASEGYHIGNLGSAYYNIGDFQRSIILLEQSILISKILGDEAEEAARIGHLGHPYFHLGEYDKAIEHYTKALTFSRNVHSIRGQGFWLWALGRANALLGNFPESLEMLKESIEIANKVEDKRLECFNLGTLGQTLLHTKAMSTALQTLKRAVTIDVPELNFFSYAIYGLVLALVGNRKSANENLHKAIAHASSILDSSNNFFEARYSRAICYLTLSMISSKNDENDLLSKAEKEYAEAILCCHAKGVIDRNHRLILELELIDSSNFINKIVRLFPLSNS